MAKWGEDSRFTDDVLYLSTIFTAASISPCQFSPPITLSVYGMKRITQQVCQGVGME